MVGDGVNDVPALKASRLAIAQGSGTQMARSVADLVLVGGDFAAVPPMVDEGRKLLRNLARVAKLFVTKSAFAAFLILSIGLTRHRVPAAAAAPHARGGGDDRDPGLLPRARAERRARSRSRDSSAVSRFAVPAGHGGGARRPLQLPVRARRRQRPLVESRTVATTTLVLVGLYLIYVLEGARTPDRRISVLGLCLAMLGLYALVLIAPGGRNFFDLALGPALPASFAGAALAAVLFG